MGRFLNPFPQHFDSAGAPTAAYNVFFGQPNQDPKTFTKAPFSDRALTVPLPTTITLDNTGSYGQDIFLDGSYSIRIETALGSLFRETPSFDGTFSSFLLEGFLVAAMVADASLAVGDFVNTVGYLAAGDGGDNSYEVVASGTPDGGSIIDLTGSGFKAKALFPGGIVTAKQFGIAGDGITSDRTELFNALTYVALTTTTDELLITDGDLLIDSALTVAQGVTVNFKRGSQLSVPTGITISWLGNITAGLYQIFNLAGTGIVNFNLNNGTVDSVYPEWWGAIADDLSGGTTENGLALQDCITAATTGKITMRVQNGGYNLSTPMIVSDRITMLGQNKEDTYFMWTGGGE